MSCDGAKQPLLSGTLDSSTQSSTNFAPAPCKKRFRRVRSAPLAEFVYEAGNSDKNGSVPRSTSIFGQTRPCFMLVVIILSIYMGVGTICFYLVRNQISGKKTNGILDAIYFCVVTMTTVGYGDLVPSSPLVKLLACVFVFTGMALIGLILSKAADYLVEKQEIMLVKALHMRHEHDPSEILKQLEANKVWYKCVVTFIIVLLVILIGTIFLATVEHLDPIDAFYCVCSTITTLGYGDKSFSTAAGRVFAVFWILTSTVCVAQFFLYVAEVFTEKRQRALTKWVLTRKVTNADLEAADIDENGIVGVAEFILYKLKEMGKITQEDIMLVMEEFEDLDVDQSGTLSASDIMLAQTTPRTE